MYLPCAISARERETERQREREKQHGGTSQQLFVWRKVCFPRIYIHVYIKNVHAGEYIHHKATASLTDKQSGAQTDFTAFPFLNMFGKAKTHRAIKRALIVMSAELEAGCEIVTVSRGTVKILARLFAI